jgi:uncharacterized sporulation protein YeaH/YhbH (DUF444 family)
MVVLFFLITYFNACIYYYVSSALNTQKDVDDGKTFVQKYNLLLSEESDGALNHDPLESLLSMCYYISTTVNIIGYGEMTPQSNREKVITIFLMFMG